MPTNKTRKTSCNPRKIPRTQADVDKAYDKGLMDGTVCGLTVMLYVLKDKFEAEDEQLQEFSDAFNYTIDSMAKGYITQADLKNVVKQEYGTVIELK
jgi:hypothetical protein